jgi:hypothetical protein
MAMSTMLRPLAPALAGLLAVTAGAGAQQDGAMPPPPFVNDPVPRENKPAPPEPFLAPAPPKPAAVPPKPAAKAPPAPAAKAAPVRPDAAAAKPAPGAADPGDDRPAAKPGAKPVEIAGTVPASAAVAGIWLIAPEAGGKGCTVNLEEGLTIGGYGVTGNEGCSGGLAKLKDAFAWDFVGPALVIRDVAQQTLVRVVPQGAGTYAEDKPAGARLLMVKAARGVDRIPTASELFGSWQLRRPGGAAICSLTLQNTPPPGGQESFGLLVADGCDAAVARLKLASWRLEGTLVVLYGTEGGSLSFEPRGAGTFVKAAKEGGKPLNLVKAK